MRRTQDFLIMLLMGALMLVLLGSGVAQAGESFPAESFFDVFYDPPPDSTLPPLIDVTKSESPIDKTVQFGIGVSELGPLGVFISNDTFDTGGPVGMPGNLLITELSLPDGDFAVDSFFDIMYEIMPIPEKPILDLKLYDEPYWVDSFFDITYEIDFMDGSFQILALHGEILPGLPIALSNVYVGDPDFPAESFFDVFFELDVPDPGQIPMGTPFMDIFTVGYYIPEPTSLALLGLGGALAAIYKKRQCK